MRDKPATAACRGRAEFRCGNATLAPVSIWPGPAGLHSAHRVDIVPRILAGLQPARFRFRRAQEANRDTSYTRHRRQRLHCACGRRSEASKTAHAAPFVATPAGWDMAFITNEGEGK